MGLSAFANTGLKSVYMSLSAGSTYSQIKAYAFAGCKQLTSVTNVGRNALASYEFANCTALREVTMPNVHDFINQGAFYGCTSLERLSFPPNTYGVSKDLAKGCTSLTSIEFQEPS